MEKCIFEVFKEVGCATGENLSHFSILLNKWEVIINPRNAGEFFELINNSYFSVRALV